MWEKCSLRSLTCRKIDSSGGCDCENRNADTSIVCSQGGGEEGPARGGLILDSDGIKRIADELGDNRASSACSNILDQACDVHSPRKTLKGREVKEKA